MAKRPTVKLDEVAAWYQERTGEDPAKVPGRLIKITSYLEAKKLRLDQVELIDNQDRDWASRANRTDRERAAVCIGKAGRRASFVWILPIEKTAPAAEERLSA